MTNQTEAAMTTSGEEKFFMRFCNAKWFVDANATGSEKSEKLAVFIHPSGQVAMVNPARVEHGIGRAGVCIGLIAPKEVRSDSQEWVSLLALNIARLMIFCVDDARYEVDWEQDAPSYEDTTFGEIADRWRAINEEKTASGQDPESAARRWVERIKELKAPNSDEVLNLGTIADL